MGLFSSGDATSQKELSKDLRQVSRFGEGRSFFSVGISYLPPLERSFRRVRRERGRQRK